MKFFDTSKDELGLELVYDVAHNIGKFEKYTVDGKERELFVHRKGATRAFPAGHPELPDKYQNVGQPVLIPGDMGTASYVLVGNPLAMEQTWGQHVPWSRENVVTPKSEGSNERTRDCSRP